MRQLEIEVSAETGGFRIICQVVDYNLDKAIIATSGAVCSTYSQISTRFKALVTVAQEHMQPIDPK